MNSLNFQEVADLQHANDWVNLQEIINDAGQSLEKAGADCILICTNLMHKCAPVLQTTVSIPIIHIVDACGEVIQANGFNKVLLLGTIYTMEESFYSERLKERFNIVTYIPDVDDRKVVSNIIYNELCKGMIKEESKQEYLRIINKVASEGMEAALLACTEIPLLETTSIHASKACEFALNEA